MAKRKKAGMPQGFTLELERPDEDAPIRSGDYLDEVLAPRPATQPKAPPPSTPEQPPQSATDVVVPADIEVPKPRPAIPTPERQQLDEQPRSSPKRAPSVASKNRTRLNVSAEGRQRLAAIVDYMKRWGPEPDVRASEVLEALILSMYDHRENLDLGNVRRRGKYGSATHKNFPISLAESVGKAIATGNADKLL